MLLPSPPKLTLAALPTPLQRLTRISADVGTTIWLKRDDLTHTAMSGNKLRKLEFVLAAAMSSGARVVITCGGVQSNHCRATAIACAQLGLKCHLLLRGARPTELDGNTLLAHLAGAECTFINPEEYANNLPGLFAQCENEYRSRGLSPYSVPTGASDEVGLWGYYTAVEELLNDMDRSSVSADLICCATGSGGTHTGLALGLHHHQFAGRVLGFAVCDDKQYFQDKARADCLAWYQRYFADRQPDIPSIEVNDQYIGRGYGQVDRPVFETIRYVAKSEGVLLDPVYTGKAFHGLLQELRAGRWPDVKNVVFVHTGGIFGVFSYRDQLSA